MNTVKEVQDAFAPVPPNQLTPGHQQRVLKISKAMSDLATDILDLVPSSADRTHALRNVLDAKFWCVQAITHVKETPNGQTKIISFGDIEKKIAALEGGQEVLIEEIKSLTEKVDGTKA